MNGRKYECYIYISTARLYVFLISCMFVKIIVHCMFNPVLFHFFSVKGHLWNREKCLGKRKYLFTYFPPISCFIYTKKFLDMYIKYLFHRSHLFISIYILIHKQPLKIHQICFQSYLAFGNKCPYMKPELHQSFFKQSQHTK